MQGHERFDKSPAFRVTLVVDDSEKVEEVFTTFPFFRPKQEQSKEFDLASGNWTRLGITSMATVEAETTKLLRSISDPSSSLFKTIFSRHVFCRPPGVNFTNILHTNF